MIYKKEEILRRLGVALNAENTKASEAHDSAVQAADQSVSLAQVDDLITDMFKYREQQNWRRMADAGYNVYQKGHELTRSKEPNFSTRDQHQRKAEGIASMMDLLKSGQADAVSTSELEKLGILPLIRYVQ